MVQTLYVPGVTSLQVQAALANNKAQTPQDVNLWMPSMICRQIPCDTNLEEIEWKLCFGQAHDALNELRQGLCSRSYMLHFKNRFYRGQGATTRCWNSLKAVNSKIDASAAKYRAAHTALLKLAPLLGKVGWKNVLWPLQDEDICSMAEGISDLSSKGRRRVSRIWLVCGYSESSEDGDAELQDGNSTHYAYHLDGYWSLTAIHVEWCKAYARAKLMGRGGSTADARAALSTGISPLAVEMVAR